MPAVMGILNAKISLSRRRDSLIYNLQQFLNLSRESWKMFSTIALPISPLFDLTQ
jgi:hypothetical protein